MRPYFKFTLFRLRNNNRLKDRKLRPIKMCGFIIQPLRLSRFGHDHRFRYDAYSVPVSEQVIAQIGNKKRIWNRTTTSWFRDAINDALESIYYIQRPLFLFHIQINNQFQSIEKARKAALELKQQLDNYKLDLIKETS